MIQKYYVTLTWHDWPEGGSYGTVVEAKDHEQAEELARAEMRATYAQEGDGEYDDDYLDERNMNWHLVDCFDLDNFIEAHIRHKPEDVWAADENYPVEQWQYEVEEDNTRLGYWEWVEHQKEMNADESA